MLLKTIIKNLKRGADSSHHSKFSLINQKKKGLIWYQWLSQFILFNIIVYVLFWLFHGNDSFFISGDMRTNDIAVFVILNFTILDFCKHLHEEIKHEDDPLPRVLTYIEEWIHTFFTIRMGCTFFIVSYYIMLPIQNDNNDLPEMLFLDDTWDLYIGSLLIISSTLVNFKLLINYSMINKVDKAHLFTLTSEDDPKGLSCITDIMQVFFFSSLYNVSIKYRILLIYILV